MIACDSSSMIAYLGGHSGSDVEELEKALHREYLMIPPVVLMELLSDPKLARVVRGLLLSLPLLEILDGFWERAGRVRAKLLQRKLKARVADVLIAQICIDHQVPLITRDSDYRHYVRLCGLKVVW